MKKIYSILSIFFAALFAASCISDTDMQAPEGGEGYLRLQVETNVNTITRLQEVPEGYAPKKLNVKILDSQDEIVMESDYDKDNGGFTNNAFSGKIKLAAGDYTIVAHSANWDGSQSAFSAPYYAGQTQVTVVRNSIQDANVECKLANVKVTVTFDDNFKKYFTSATSEVSSALDGVFSQTFVMNQTTESAYFPVANLTHKITVNGDPNKSKEYTIEDVQARDHYKINYHVADPTGDQGTIKVYIDDATNVYVTDVFVPITGSKIDFQFAEATDMTADAFDGGSVTLGGKVTGEDLQKDKIVLRYRQKGATEWTTVPNNELTSIDVTDGANYTCSLTGLAAGVAYECQLAQEDELKPSSSDIKEFTIKGEDIYNGGFENWYMDGKIAICGSQDDSKYWNSSNAGAANYVGSVTTQETSFVHSGSSSAKLATKYAVIKLAAASLFTGDFIGLIGTKGAKLDWGVPFTSRPTALRGYYSYTPGSINRGTQPSGVGAPAKNENDECQIYCALVTEQFHVANAAADGYEMTTDIDWETDPRVVAYGQMTQNTSSNGAWQELNIPLVYHSTTLKPTHMIIVCSSSKWGDYFYGSDSSVLYLDDFELSYAGTPTVKQ